MSTIAVEVAAEEPSPTTFPSLGLSEPLCRAVSDLGYQIPTPIQEQTIPRLLAGQDIIAQARTGTGKTAAFALPLLDKLKAGTREPQALILAPTRELAVQVARSIADYGQHRRVSVLAVYGGQPIEQQLRPLQRGVQVVVGTPGRLLDHIRRGSLKLSAVHTVVLDEADEMLDMGFAEDIEAILQETPATRQTALFSATLPGPIVALGRRYLRDPEQVTVAQAASEVAQIRQIYFDVGQRDKFAVLVRVLQHEAPVSSIVFCRTRGDADALGERLTGRGLPADALHGDLSQVQRDRVMGRFRSGQVGILVATDVASRGLDIDHVSHVINFDLPYDAGVYVHRIGRTGRAGRSGCALTLLSPGERRLLRAVEQQAGVRLLRQAVPTLEAVRRRRHERFKESLQEVAPAESAPYQELARDLLEQGAPEEVLAAALRLLLGEADVGCADPLAEAEPELVSPRASRSNARPGRDFGRDNGRDSGRDNGRGPRTARGMTRLFLNIGLSAGLRPADLVGAIANEAGLPGRSVGQIDLLPTCSFVDVPSDQAERVMAALRNTLVRGRKIAPAVARS